MTVYMLVHRPELDATGVRLGATVDEPPIPLDLVTFRIVAPVDEHEARLTVTTSRAAWESQGSPEELYVTLTAPLPEETL